MFLRAARLNRIRSNWCQCFERGCDRVSSKLCAGLRPKVGVGDAQLEQVSAQLEQSLSILIHFTRAEAVTVVLYCLLLVQSQIALWDNANTMLSPSDQLTN